MKTTAHICDNCFTTDGETILAAGQYTTEAGTFDACADHLDEAGGYGWPIHPYPQEGNPQRPK